MHKRFGYVGKDSQGTLKRSDTIKTTISGGLFQAPADDTVMTIYMNQRTLAKPFSCSGTGVHSGVRVNLTVHPAPANHGIRFQRSDLPDSPTIRALFRNVVDTSLATVIGQEGAIVSTIEHLMATFAGLAIDNALVTIDGYEMPIMDGSARVFAEGIMEAGIVALDKPRSFLAITKKVELCEGDKRVTAVPCDHFSITCGIAFNHPMINEQSVTLDSRDNTFLTDISPARTFGFYRDIKMLKLYGLGRGAELDTGIALTDDGIMNEGGLRFPDEFARHKLLDCLGDFSLLGMPILAHITTSKSGHAFNHAFLETLFEHKDSWETRTVEADAL